MNFQLIERNEEKNSPSMIVISGTITQKNHIQGCLVHVRL
ncbi:hypothetical protein SORDD16_01068 [Streptococcus oralis]|uniref:Uncharacterized protein n=1 Tax=Streptococcus oralis TaxID=1303 RepID=A0A139PDA4_STROR|nr:hypothetical protein SORDD16_01068 [Streptococcus oralis]